ncbi:MAG: hypothetical protein ACK5HL_01510 [Bacilli bacterium]
MSNEKEKTGIAVLEKDSKVNETFISINESAINNIGRIINCMPKYSEIIQKELELTRLPIKNIVAGIELASTPIMQLQKAIETSTLPIRRAQQLIAQSMPTFLPDILVSNEDDFKKLIDWLYKLFWDNNQKIRSCVPNNEFSFINDLRKYYYHDLEHGDEKNIMKKMLKVKNFFEKACGIKYPTDSNEWKKSQEYVYELLEDILPKIKTSI